MFITGVVQDRHRRFEKLRVAVCVLLFLIEVLWRFTLTLRLSSQPVAVSMLASFTILLLVDGMIEDTILPLMVLAVSVAVLEFIVYAVRRIRQRPHTIMPSPSRTNVLS